MKDDLATTARVYLDWLGELRRDPQSVRAQNEVDKYEAALRKTSGWGASRPPEHPVSRKRGVLVPERGLRNTRRNRRWLALVRMFSHQIPGGDQATCEALAWAAINTWEITP